MSSPISIVAGEDNTNLREVTWNQRFLDAVKNAYKLRHGQAVLYRNAAQDRWRLVACFYGMAVLILPPIDPQERLSLDLEVSRFLRKFSEGYDGGLVFLEEQIAYNASRLAKMKKKTVKKPKKSRGK